MKIKAEIEISLDCSMYDDRVSVSCIDDALSDGIRDYIQKFGNDTQKKLRLKSIMAPLIIHKTTYTSDDDNENNDK